MRSTDLSTTSRLGSSLSQLFFVAVSVSEHYKSVSPSTLTTSYALCLGLFGAAELRSLAAVGLQSSSAFIPKAIVVSAIFALLTLETAQKRSLLHQKYLVCPSSCLQPYLSVPEG